MLEIKGLCSQSENTKIISDLNLTVNKGETHVIVGPNGSGKSTLGKSLLKAPWLTINASRMLFNKHDLLELSTTDVAKLGIFLVFQNPRSVSGLELKNYLYEICKQKIINESPYDNLQETRKDPKYRKQLSLVKIKAGIQEVLEKLNLSSDYLDRDLNVDFSGGEKKKIELLQLMLLKPSLAIIDEIDSGLDVEALKVCAQALRSEIETRDMSTIIITHNQEILKYLEVDYVHLFEDGTISKSGDKNLANKILQDGFKSE